VEAVGAYMKPGQRFGTVIAFWLMGLGAGYILIPPGFEVFGSPHPWILTGILGMGLGRLIAGDADR